MIFRTAIPCTAILIAAALFSTAAAAQYKYTGPDGRVIYSDTPPPSAPKGAKPPPVEKKDLSSGTTSTGAANLPYALGQTTKNFPVTLYTTAGCDGCDQGRTFLSKRGIPFAEKTVSTNEDLVALKSLAGSSGLPVMTVGNNKLMGYEPTAWGAALDTVGYPATSALPASYKAPAAVAVVPKKPPEQASEKAPAKPEAAPDTAAAPAAPAVAPEATAQRPTWFRGF